MQETTLENPKSYFQQRMDLLGVTSKNNSIELWENVNESNEHKDVLIARPIFRELPEGIEIIVYTLDRQTIRIQKNGSRIKKNFSIVRLENPVIRPDGSRMKYRLPKGSGTHPFFPPALVEKFDKKEDIETLYVTEGYIKAFKASDSGIDMIGLSSITHMKDQETGKLHKDIIRLMKDCKVRRMVWLTDGDALDITQGEISEASDLSKRPKNFFHTIVTFKTLLDDYEDVEKYFFYIDTDNILNNNPGKLREDVKGIDDLLIALPKKTKEIVADINSVNSGSYFQKFNISYSTSKVYNHFHLRDVKDFYLFHVERRPELKNTEFIFNGTRYLYNDETGECDVKIPGAAKLYFRVDDDYYKHIKIPNQHDFLENTFHSRQKGTIKDDHGPNFCKYIPKYETFCNVPSHTNFQPVIHNCFNVYSPLDYYPDDEECFAEDCQTIMGFLHHIFGDRTASYIDSETKEKKEYSSMDIGLDYLQLLYQKPTQKLPILCLVSRENNTGKSTLANFTRMMLGANVAIVGNADLVSDFNAHWASKNVVICDETKIDKQHVIEKIKSLSTAKKIFMNAKGRGQVELDCFIKFVLITNNEDNFISVSDEDTRYWIIKVPKLEKENPTISELFDKEMPAFLSFISRRKLATEHKNRMWFHPDLLGTEAFEKVKENSQSAVEKNIRHYFKEMFLDLPEEDEILMTLPEIHVEIFKESTKYDQYYIKRVLTENLKIFTYRVWHLINDATERKYRSEEDAISDFIKKFRGESPEGKIKSKTDTIRSRYPIRLRNLNEGEDSIKWIKSANAARPYVFKRKDFIKKGEDEIIREKSTHDDEPF